MTRRARLHAVAGLGAITTMLLGSVAPLAAQIINPYANRNTPYGSPLDPTGQAGTSTDPNGQSQSQFPGATTAGTTGDTGANERPGAAEVRDTQRQTAADRLLEQQERAREQQDLTDRSKPVAPPSEFELFVERTIGRPLPRFGANLLLPGARDFAVPTTSAVPASYVLQPGDQLFIGLTGSIEGTVDAEIGVNGRIFLPKVGAVKVAGIPYGALRETIARAVAGQYRDFKVAVAVTRLRGIRVYVTGFANNPGAYTVSSLSTLTNAVLAAGGPNQGGSFRAIKLYRGGQLVSDYDLYDLLLKGDKSKDAILENEDVLFIPPVGNQVAVTGSVNAEAIYEAAPGDSLDSVLRYAGGANALADQSRAILYRLSNLDTIGGQEVSRAQLAATPAAGGDIVQVLSTGTLARPLERQSVVVRVEGEVNRPGNYYVPPNTSLDQVMALAGGLTPRAFPYGVNLQRLSVRQQQRQSFLEAVQQLELTLAAAPLTGDTSVDAATRAGQLASAQAVLERLRQAEPDGRVVMNLAPDATMLPGQLTVENSDRIVVPPRPVTVGVFGAVYRPASFLIEGSQPLRVRDYIEKAGGAQRAADKGQVFVVRANGEVLSRRTGALRARVLPGDVIFMPVKTQSSSVLTRILQISSLVFQLGLTAATVAAVSN